MNHVDCVAITGRHPKEAAILAAVAYLRNDMLSLCDDSNLMVVVWAIDAANRWAKGAAERDEMEAVIEATSEALLCSRSPQAHAAYYLVMSAYSRLSPVFSIDDPESSDSEEERDQSRSMYVSRLGRPGKWGVYSEHSRGDLPRMGIAGDYIWDGEFFRSAGSLTEMEKVAVDASLEAVGRPIMDLTLWPCLQEK